MTPRRLALAFLFFAAPLFAQTNITIHGHPQKSVYATPSEWFTDSGQMHWLKAGAVTPCHLHIEPTLPIYGEWPATFSFPVQFQLFHCDGYLSQVWSDHGFFVLDAYGSWKEYIHLNGDPNGVVVFTGRFYFDIARADNTVYKIPLHGWTGIQLNARVLLKDGATVWGTKREPFYSMRNPAAPEALTNCDGCGPLLRAQNAVQSPTDPLNAWGAAIVEFREMVPIAPLTDGQVWTAQPHFFGYGTNSGLVQTVERRLDMDLHHGNPGTLLTSSFPIDTHEIGTGDHKVAFILNARVPAGLPGFTATEQAAVLAVLPLTVGPGTNPVPPPDPEPPPEPPPLPVWTLGTVWTTGDPPIFKLCPGGNPDASDCVIP